MTLKKVRLCVFFVDAEGRANRFNCFAPDCEGACLQFVLVPAPHDLSKGDQFSPSTPEV